MRTRGKQAVGIPLPEHPRPDFERDQWQNLNGPWQFQFDAPDSGEARGWIRGELPTLRQILVPFPWGSPLSGVPDSAVIGWYARSITVPAGWAGRRVFLVIGAADWRTTAWLDGQKLGSHDGGYIPFEFELTKYVKTGHEQRLVLRVDDAPRAFKLEGKQGYGNARGIWQTPYIEARGGTPLRTLHFSPDVDRGRVLVAARLVEQAPRDLTLTLRFRNAELPTVTWRIPKGADGVTFDVPVPHAHLWSLDDPFLYEVEATVRDDRVQEGNVGIWTDTTSRWTDWLRTTVGIREDIFAGHVFSDTPDNSGNAQASMTSPKAGKLLSGILKSWGGKSPRPTTARVLFCGCRKTRARP